jgi:hypothetical protein
MGKKQQEKLGKVKLTLSEFQAKFGTEEKGALPTGPRY